MKAQLSNLVNKAKLGIDNHKPEIFLGLSIASTVGCAVTSWKAGTKTNALIEEHKKQMDEKDKIMERHEDDTDMTAREKAQYLFWVYKNEVIRFAKIFGIPIALGILSVTCSFMSYKIQKNRNLSLAAINAGLVASLSAYRKNVANKVGEEAEKDLYFGREEKEITQPVTDKNGKEKEVTKKVKVSNGFDPMYTFDFNSETSNLSTNDLTYDTDLIGQVQEQLDHDLSQNGYLFLNDALKLLGMQIVDYGQDVGWVYDLYHNDRGENHIEITIIETSVELINGGYKPAIKINFNCDGNIRNDMYNWQDYDTTGLPSAEVA